MTRLQRLWGIAERPRSLALVRMAIAAVILADLLVLAVGGLPGFVFGLPPEGIASPVWLDALLPVDGRAWALWGVMVGLALAFGAGLFTRTVCVLLLLCSAQTAMTFAIGDRAIDRMLRNALVILAFSRCGAWGSIDAWRRTGTFWGDGAAVPAWPRHLLVFQLVAMYFSAGLHKIGAAWGPVGDYAAMFYVLQDPGVSRWAVDWHGKFGFTQWLTAVSIYWEYLAPLVLLAYWYRHTAAKGGRMRRLFARLRPDRWWVLVGVGFHLGIALFLTLGIFPWGMLALYPAFVHPDRWPRVGATPSAPARAHPAKAAVLTAVCLIIAAHALPWPRKLAAHEIKRQVVREQVEPWLPTAKRLGMGDTIDEAWASAVRWSHRLNAVQRGLERPFRPFFNLTRTGQHWHLFTVPGPSHHRMTLEGFAGMEGRILFRTRDPDHAWAKATVHSRRLRPVFWMNSRRRHPAFDAAARWVAARAFAERPELTSVRLTIEAGQSHPPPAASGHAWRIVFTRVYPRG